MAHQILTSLKVLSRFLLLAFYFAQYRVDSRRPAMINVLFIVSDDMRADIGPYSPKYAVFTPNLNQLAQSSLVFDNAFVSQAVCGPSRNSFLTGRRPDSLRSWNFLNSCRKFGSQVQTIPQSFRLAGYETLSVGKVFHIYEDIGDDATNSWSSVFLAPGISDDDTNCPRNSLWCTCDPTTCADALIAQTAISLINARDKIPVTKRKPWFLAVGFRRPHPDFVVDASFPTFNNFTMPIADQQIAPNFGKSLGMPPVAFYSCSGFQNQLQFKNELMLPWTPSDPSLQSHVRMAYWRAAAYMDYQLGLVLKALESSSFVDNTIVVFTADHGFHLGERAMWCKQSVFESVTRVPLLMRVPWLSETSSGKRSTAIAELIDLYPTLVSLVGNSAPSLSLNTCAEGKDLTALFKNQDALKASELDLLGGISSTDDIVDFSKTSFALSQYPRCIEWQNPPNIWTNPCTFTNTFNYMGYSIRTNRWRYTEWRAWLGSSADWSDKGLNATELYDHGQDDIGNIDYDNSENLNVASLNPDVTSKLSLALRVVVIGGADSQASSCRPLGYQSVTPTSFPTLLPSVTPSAIPTHLPTPKPTPGIRITKGPTRRPSLAPTTKTERPSKHPVFMTSSPSRTPTNLTQTKGPTNQPTRLPISANPSISVPSLPPSVTTEIPSSRPSKESLVPSTSFNTPTLSPSFNFIDNEQCHDTNAFCANSDWTCGVSQVCMAGEEAFTLRCPCWQYSEIVEQAVSDSSFLHSRLSTIMVAMAVLFLVLG